MTAPRLGDVLAQRWTVAQSWWIASEICRRNDELRIDQDHDGDALRLHVRRDLPRDSGGAKHVTFHTVHGIEHVEPSQWISWVQVFGTDDPHGWVQRIEQSFAWALPTASPTSGRSLAYRTIARILTDTVNDRVRPEVVSWDTMLGATPHDLSWLSLFDGAASGPTPHGHVRDAPLWVLFRGGRQGVLVISERGTAHRRDGAGPVDLLARYQERRHMDDVIHGVMPAP